MDDEHIYYRDGLGRPPGGVGGTGAVVYKGLAAGKEAAAEVEVAGAAEVVWFVNRPLIGPVMEAVERAGR